MGTRVATGRRVILAVLAAQVALAAVGVGWWRWGAASAPAVPAAVGEEASIPLPATLEGGYAVAAERARAWRAGAEPLGATLQVDWPWDPPPPGPATAVPGTGWLTYDFVAPWEPRGQPQEAASLGVVVERLTGAVVAEHPLGWEEAPAFGRTRPDPAVSSSEAVLAAEASGGTDFRRACPVQRHLTRVSLVAGTVLPTHWLVTYQHERPDEGPETHALVLRIDAESAAVLASEGVAPPCGAGV